MAVRKLTKPPNPLPGVMTWKGAFLFWCPDQMAS
jgi:hypothetical protein